MAVCGIQKMLGFASLNPTYPAVQFADVRALLGNEGYSTLDDSL